MKIVEIVAVFIFLFHGRPSIAGDIDTKSGSPGITWSASRKINLFANEIQFRGFRIFGEYEFAGGSIKSFPSPANGGYNTYDYDVDREGFGAPNMGAGDELWVGVFGVAKSTDSNAKVRFLPLLEVESFNTSANTATFKQKTSGNLVAGNMTVGFFNNDKALIITEGKKWSYRIVDVTSNTATSITFSQTVNLTVNDFVLLAPTYGSSSPYLYKYFKTLKFDGNAGGSYEWRNFQMNGDFTHSYHGNPFGSLRASTWTELDFTSSVSPLATGVIGAVHVYSLYNGISAAYIYFGHDSSNHVVYQLGLDRTQSYGDGVSGQAIMPFSREKKSLWYQVNNGTYSVGDIVVMGWLE